MALIEFQKVHYTPSGRKTPLFRDLSLSIDSGEYICIAGANGSGKSTLVRLIKSLIQPDTGKIHIEGINPQAKNQSSEVARKVAMVFQNPENQIISSLVEDDIAFGPENLGWDSPRIEKSIGKSLRKVGLEGFEKRSTHGLSAGQQQKICLAGALAMEPQCIILDEASSMLNPTARLEWRQLLKELHQQGKTIISVTHQMEELLDAQRVLVLQNGEIKIDSSPEKLLRSKDLSKLGLAPLVWTSLAKNLRIKSSPAPLSLKALSPNIDWANPPSLLLEDKGKDKPIAIVQDLYYRYPHSDKGIHGLDFTIMKGERLMLLGESGSGKTTLLQLLAGVSSPDKGNLQWMENPVKGLVMQNPQAQLFKVFVGDDVAFGPSNQGLQGRELSVRVSQAMELCGLPFQSFKDRRILELSGGEKRKAALAGVLALNPQVLLLDEPSGGLDPQAQKELAMLLDTLQERGVTLIIATHHMEEAARGDRVLNLQDGNMTELTPSREFFYRPHRGLLAPAMVEVSLEGRRRGYPWPNLLRLEEMQPHPGEVLC